MVILIVEDEFLIGLGLQMALRLGGHRVIGPAATAVEALRLADGEPPDMAFVDINIRGNRDGIAVARALTERHATSCVYVTAQVDLARSAKDAALGVIEKPYDLLDIVSAADVVATMRKGRQPSAVPKYLELFDLTPTKERASL